MIEVAARCPACPLCHLRCTCLLHFPDLLPVPSPQHMGKDNMVPCHADPVLETEIGKQSCCTHIQQMTFQTKCPRSDCFCGRVCSFWRSWVWFLLEQCRKNVLCKAFPPITNKREIVLNVIMEQSQTTVMTCLNKAIEHGKNLTKLPQSVANKDTRLARI